MKNFWDREHNIIVSWLDTMIEKKIQGLQQPPKLDIKHLKLAKQQWVTTDLQYSRWKQAVKFTDDFQ